MPFVERSITIASDPHTVYEIAKRMEDFPKYMENVKEVTVVERDETSTVTRWHATIVGRHFRWTERDEFDDETPQITYEQLDGDLKVFQGVWRFLPQGDGEVRVELTCEAEIGIPMLDSLLNPVIKKAIEINIDSMLKAIKEQAER